MTPPGPTIRGNSEKGEEDELTATFVAFFLFILFGALLFSLNIKKQTDEVGCLNTLMNSLNEVISVTFAPS